MMAEQPPTAPPDYEEAQKCPPATYPNLNNAHQHQPMPMAFPAPPPPAAEAMAAQNLEQPHSQYDQYWRDYAHSSCCGTVERGARIIAWLSIVLGVVLVILGLFNIFSCGSNRNIGCDLNKSGISILCNVVSVGVSYLIILAQDRRAPALYLPYIILSIIGLICYAVILFLMIVIALVTPTLFIVDAFLAAIFVLCLWMFRIVWRAYRVLKEEVRTGIVVPKV